MAATSAARKNPFTGPFFNEMRQRIKHGRDAKIFVTAENGETGVSKTSGAVCLGYILDNSVSGLTPDSCTVQAPEFIQRYDSLPKQGVLIGDEWTSEADSRRANSHGNVNMSYQWAMRRYREIPSIIILPSKADLDRRIQRLADYWILVTARGEATIHKVMVDRYDDDLFFKPLQRWSWPNMDGDPVYEHLENLKRQKSEGDALTEYFTKSEVKEIENKARMEGKESERLQALQHMTDERGLSQTDAGEIFGISQGRVSQLLAEA
jgi:predicted XRE-type DNA-binding protein